MALWVSKSARRAPRHHRNANRTQAAPPGTQTVLCASILFLSTFLVVVVSNFQCYRSQQQQHGSRERVNDQSQILPTVRFLFVVKCSFGCAFFGCLESWWGPSFPPASEWSATQPGTVSFLFRSFFCLVDACLKNSLSRHQPLPLSFCFFLSFLVGRIRKEVEYYIQEVADNEQQWQCMKDGNRDPYDLKKFAEVVAESRMMIPDSQRRFEAAIRDLQHCLEAWEASTSSSSSSSSTPLSTEAQEGEWPSKAREILQQWSKDYKPPEKVSDTTSASSESPKTTTTTTNVDQLAPDEVF